MNPRLLVSAVAFTLVAGFVVAVGAQSAGFGQRSLSGSTAANAATGRLVATGGPLGELRFACASCHGMDGAGDGSGAFPRLSGQSGWYLYSTLNDFAHGTRLSKVMGPVASELTDAQMQAVSAYYAAQSDAAFSPPLQTDDALRATGQRIAEQGLPQAGVPACMSCHSSAGAGRPPVYPAIGGQYPSYLETQLKLFKSGQRGGDNFNVMHGIAEHLTGEQIKAVSAYFASLTPQWSGGETQAEEARSRVVRPLARQTGADLTPKPDMGKKVLLPDRGPPQ